MSQVEECMSQLEGANEEDEDDKSENEMAVEIVKLMTTVKVWKKQIHGQYYLWLRQWWHIKTRKSFIRGQ